MTLSANFTSKSVFDVQGCRALLLRHATQSAVMVQYVVRPTVQVSFSHRLEYFEK